MLPDRGVFYFWTVCNLRCISTLNRGGAALKGFAGSAIVEYLDSAREVARSWPTFLVGVML